jgi:hypothetical protein
MWDDFFLELSLMLLAEKLVFVSLKWLVHLMFFHNFKQWLKSSWSPQIILQES